MRPGVLAAAGLAAAIVAAPDALRQPRSAHPIAWADVAPVHHLLGSRGITAATFPSYVDTLRKANARRVHEGDLDHLIFYLLQSTRFTNHLPIEPALSAKRHAETGEIPDVVRSRVGAFVRAVNAGRGRDARFSYFRDLTRATFPEPGTRQAGLLREYARVMKFVYEKEFVAQRSGRRDAAIAELYRTRGLSTDTALEAGFLVSQGLAVARGLDPARRIRRVLIVGPGLDLAPRTGLLESSAPESYQPWAVIDALLALGLSRPDDLTVLGADINPRVVRHLRQASGKARTLTLVSAIAESDAVSLSTSFREYFAQLGRHLQTDNLRRDREAAERSEAASAKRDRERSEREARGGGAPRAVREERSEREARGGGAPRAVREERSEREARGSLQPPRRTDVRRDSARGWGPGRTEKAEPQGVSITGGIGGHLRKTVRVDPAVARALDGAQLDIVTERLASAPFDLVVATNIFPYFDDLELALALANIASMLAPGGLLLHNEPRPSMEELTPAAGLRLEQSRHAIVATVRGGPPLADSVFLHRKSAQPGSGMAGAR